MRIKNPLEHKGKLVLLVLSFLWIFIFNAVESNAQQLLSWAALADVTFSESYDDSLKVYWLVPTFGKQPKDYENKTVILEGYFIPLDEEANFHVLSKYPYSSCFFCGAAGPETVVELELDRKYVKDLNMDEPLRFQGTFVLNVSDYYHCNYILKEAYPLKKN